MDAHKRSVTRPRRLALWFGLLAVIALVALVAAPGGGHPSLGGVLLMWVAFPTLAAYLSRALLGSDFPPTLLLFVGALEYLLLGYGILSLIIASLSSWSRARLGTVLLAAYLAAHLAAHVALNQHSVNVRLLADPNHAVSNEAVARIAAADDYSAVPALHDRFMRSFEQYGNVDESLIVALTQLGGAKGWQDLLESGRLGVRGNEARMWGVVSRRVRYMSDPEYVAMRGAVKTRDLRDEDIARLSDALGSRLAERLRDTPDSEASLTLIALMNGRRDLCAKYFALVPNGLRDARNPELARVLTAIRGGQSPEMTDVYVGAVPKEDLVRLDRELDAVADEWTSWAASDAAPCRTP